MGLEVECKIQKKGSVTIYDVARSEDGYTVDVIVVEGYHCSDPKDCRHRCKGKGKTLPQAIRDCIKNIRSALKAQFNTDFVIAFTAEVVVRAVGSSAWQLLGGA